MNNQKIKFGILTYISRSGSTLLSRMLDDYDDVCVTTEGELPLELFGVKSYAPIQFSSTTQIKKYLEQVVPRTRVSSWDLSNAEILERCEKAGYPLSGPSLVKIILAVYRDTYKPQAELIIYKACPLMPWHIQESLAHFPDAQFLHILRDPRAVYNSQMKSLDPFTKKPFANSALKTAIDWKIAAEATERDTSPVVKELKCEALLDDPEPTIQALLQFFQLENKTKSGGGKSFVQRMTRDDQELHQDISLEPNPDKNLVWQTNLSDRDIRLIESYLTPLLVEKGYSLFSSVNTSNPIHRLDLFLSIQKQKILRITKRLYRVIGNVISNPMYQFQKFKLKIKNG